MEGKIQTVCLLVLAAIAVAFALHWLRPLMIPFVLSILFSLVLTYLIDLQKRHLRIPGTLALIITLTAAILLSVMMVSITSTSIRDLAQNVGMYENRISRLIADIAAWPIFERFGIDVQQSLRPLVNGQASNVGSMLLGTTNAILDILSRGALVLIFTMFLMLGREKQGRPPRIWRQVQDSIRRYLMTKLLVSALTGLLVGASLSFFRVDLAMVFGLFAFLLNFIPSLGSIVATLLPIPVVLVSELSAWEMALAIGLPGLVQFSIGNILEPKILGDTLNLHPVSVLSALIFWGMLWGVVGMFLAVPITASLVILMSRLEQTRPIADLLAGRLWHQVKDNTS